MMSEPIFEQPKTHEVVFKKGKIKADQLIDSSEVLPRLGWKAVGNAMLMYDLS